MHLKAVSVLMASFFLLSLVSAELGYNNPTLPQIESPTTGGATSTNVTNINNTYINNTYTFLTDQIGNNLNKSANVTFNNGTFSGTITASQGIFIPNTSTTEPFKTYNFTGTPSFKIGVDGFFSSLIPAGGVASSHFLTSTTFSTQLLIDAYFGAANFYTWFSNAQGDSATNILNVQFGAEGDTQVTPENIIYVDRGSQTSTNISEIRDYGDGLPFWAINGRGGMSIENLKAQNGTFTNLTVANNISGDTFTGRIKLNNSVQTLSFLNDNRLGVRLSPTGALAVDSNGLWVTTNGDGSIQTTNGIGMKFSSVGQLWTGYSNVGVQPYPLPPGSTGQVLTSNTAITGGLEWLTPTSTVNVDVVDGRLTLLSGNATPTTDQLAKTTVYFTNYKGNRISTYNASTATWTARNISELNITVPSIANNTFDVFIDYNGSNIVLSTTTWTNYTTRATNIVLQDGVYAKSGDTGKRYLGTVGTTTVTGQTEDSRKNRLVWNYYNRINRPLQIKDGATTTWSYATSVTRAWNADAPTWTMKIVEGVAEDTLVVNAKNVAQPSGVSATGTYAVVLSINSESTERINATISSPQTIVNPAIALSYSEYTGGVPIGISNIIPYEWTSVAVGTMTIYNHDATNIPPLYDGGVYGTFPN